MCDSSITSNKPLMVFPGTDPQHAVEDYFNAVTANFILSIEPEPINTPPHRNWVHKRSFLIKTTLYGSAEKQFSVLPIEDNQNKNVSHMAFQKI